MTFIGRMWRRFVFFLRHGTTKERMEAHRTIIGHCTRCGGSISMADEMECASCHSRNLVIYGLGRREWNPGGENSKGGPGDGKGVR